MKIIAETKIGSREKYYNYHNNGVAGIFINKDSAVCRYCSSVFQFNSMCHYEAIEEISCPICGRHYKKSEIMFFLAGLLRAALLPTTSGLSKPFFLS